MGSTVTPGRTGRASVRTRRALVALLVVLGLAAVVVSQSNLALADRVVIRSSPDDVAETLDVAYGPAAAQRLDVFVPEGPQHGTIVYFHSGGWSGGSKSDLPHLIRTQTAAGWSVVSVDYRLAGEPGILAPQVLADVDRSIRYVKANAEVLGVDTTTVVAAGWSAGAQLALMAATAPGFQVASDLPAALAAESPAVDGVVALSAMTDLATWARSNPVGERSVQTLLGCTIGQATSDPTCDPATLDLYSPTFRATAAAWLGRRLPPAYFAAGSADPLVVPAGQTVALHDRWAKVTGSAAAPLDLVRDAGHDVAPAVDGPRFTAWLAAVAARSF